MAFFKWNRATGWSALTVILATTGCAHVDVVAEQQTLLETDMAFAQLVREDGPAKAFAAYLMADAIQLPNGGHPIEGRDAIHQALLDAGQFTLEWQPKVAEVSAAGDMGYTWGTYEVKLMSGHGAAVTAYGKYLNVWKKQSDGSWRIVIEMSNQSPKAP